MAKMLRVGESSNQLPLEFGVEITDATRIRARRHERGLLESTRVEEPHPALTLSRPSNCSRVVSSSGMSFASKLPKVDLLKSMFMNLGLQLMSGKTFLF